ncbi:MAG: YbgA family protein [Vicinamibacterales bacterium]
MSSDAKPRIGVSACLLGRPVRFDGGHKRDPFLVETFGQHVEWVSVCPEVEAGLGTPRETMRLVLVGTPGREKGETYPPDRVTLIVHKSGADVTALMRRFARARVEALTGERLSGFVLKKDSPSCGMERVKVYAASGPAERAGRGLFAEALLARWPNLPVEEEGRLGDPRLRDNFVERVFAYQRLRQLFDRRWTIGDLVQFHTAHKLTLMAHAPVAYRELGRLVAGARQAGRKELQTEYAARFMQALTVIATPSRQANVLQHMLGYFKQSLDAAARAELLDLIEQHRLGRVPLIVPITLFKHHVRRLNVAYLAGQVYLDPHPRELSLRNHV